MPKNTTRFWFFALVIAWAVDFLFFDKPLGISYLIWMVVLIGATFWLARSEGLRVAPASYVLSGLMLLLAAIPVLRQEPFTRLAAAGVSLSGALLLAATFLTGYWPWHRLSDHLLALLGSLAGSLIRPLDLIIRPRSETSETPKDSSTGWKNFWRKAGPVLRGLLLALPVVAVLAALLASADPIFADRLEKLLEIFDLKRLPEYLFRGFYIAIFTFLFTGALLHALFPKKPGSRPNPDEVVLKPFLGSTEATIILVSVNLLFISFVILQVQYLFGGQANITASGYTYSEYARRGFGELVAVAVISLVLYLTLGSVAKRETTGRQRLFSALAVILVGLVMVILASALQRLLLYEEAYGFTRLRAYTLIFIPWLALLLFTTIVLELVRKSGRFGLALLVTVTGFALTFGVWSVDGWIARQNVARAQRGAELDPMYLRQLSDDSVPALVDMFNQPGLLPEVRDVVGKELACRNEVLKDQTSTPWQGFTFSHLQARQLLANSSAWDQYEILHNEYGPYTLTPQDEIVYCNLSGGWD